MPTSTLEGVAVDYRPIIRAELLATIERLKRAFRANHRVDPERVEIGYFRNLHHGQPIFESWEQPGDLPWCVEGLHDVRVVGDVKNKEEYWDVNYDADTADDWDKGCWKIRYRTTYEMETDL